MNDNVTPSAPLEFLDFEKPIVELEAKIEELRHLDSGTAININDEIGRLQSRGQELLRDIFSSLTSWQIAQLSRHPRRPHTIDYIARLFTDFEELHGDRGYADDPAVVGGIARFADRPVMVIGHEKGSGTQDKLRRNFGMPRPEGYRKARRLMRLADRFGIPILTFTDTPGAYPGVCAEQRNQSEAIAGNLAVMAELGVPIIATIIGEGGSGGALALGLANRVFMQEYSTFSVISPEGCASILWKDTGKARQAAEVLGLTATQLKKYGLIDGIVSEPLGGAHRDVDAAARSLKECLLAALGYLLDKSREELRAERRLRYRGFGFFKEA